MDQYLREFDFRYNVRKMNDRDRNVLAVKKTVGKRLTLRDQRNSVEQLTHCPNRFRAKRAKPTKTRYHSDERTAMQSKRRMASGRDAERAKGREVILCLTSWAKFCNFITTMEHNHPHLAEFAQECVKAVSPLAPILHRAMEPSIEEARAFFHHGRRFDAYVFADLCRYFTCCRLASTYLPDGIVFSRLRNNGILFDCYGRTVRVWKADEEGELQGPGSSKTKREYFDQPFLSLFSPDPTAIKLAVVWEHDFSTGILRLSLVCPKSFDTYRPWQNPDCHFYVEFPHAATGVQASPRFQEPPTFLEDIDLKPKRKAEDAGPDEGQDND